MSIHFNGFDHPSLAGTATDLLRKLPPAARTGLRVADSGHDHCRSVSASVSTPDIGLIDHEDPDSPSFTPLGANYTHLGLLGLGVRGCLVQATAILETLFLTNAKEATSALQPEIQELFASAPAKAIGSAGWWVAYIECMLAGTATSRSFFPAAGAVLRCA